jgi:hypothetical protein
LWFDEANNKARELLTDQATPEFRIEL